MSMPDNFIKKAFQSSFAYITSALLIFLILSRLTARWEYMLVQVIGRQLFFTVLTASVIGFIVVHRRRIADILAQTNVKAILIMLILGSAVYNQVPFVEFLILTYALFSILFIRQYSASVFSAIFNNESRTPALFALLFIIAIPFLLVLKKSGAAEQLAIYAYYFLVLTVVLQVLEVKLRIERENPLFDLLKEFSIRGRDAFSRLRWTALGPLLQRPAAIKIAVFTSSILLIVAVHSIYWKKFIRNLDKQPAYQYKVTLPATALEHIEFASTVDEVTVPLKLIHPFSNPRVWSNTGVNPVNIGIQWYEQGQTDALHDALFEDRFALSAPLYINDSQNVQLKLNRPPLPGGRSYEVRIGLVHEGIRWFATHEGSAAKLNVTLQSSLGLMPLTRELQALRQSRIKLADAWGDKLELIPGSYVSKLELLSQSDSAGLNSVKIAVTNRSKLPWPSFGSKPVQVGVIWIQKSKDRDKVIYSHRGEEVFPLAETLFPGKREIAEIRFDPFKYPDADEIWVGMVHGGKHWFYRWNDDVIKLTNKRNMSSRDLEDIEAESHRLLSEAKQLESDNRALLNRINDPSVSIKDKYRSNIFVNDASTNGSMQASAGTVMDLDLSVKNRGSVIWPVGIEKAVNLGILWFNKESKAKSYHEKTDEQRCSLPHNLPGGTTSVVDCKIAIRVPPGQYEMWVGPVHEGVTWFFDKGDELLKIKVTVK